VFEYQARNRQAAEDAGYGLAIAGCGVLSDAELSQFFRDGEDKSQLAQGWRPGEVNEVSTKP
jgi:hypothetical protein